MAEAIRVGIDTGGTFTDFVFLAGNKIGIHKVLSTPKSPEKAILHGLKESQAEMKQVEITHGTTVATNALLERKGAKLAFLVTEGFEDLLSIGRQTRRELYNIMVEKREALIPRDLCFGIKERTTASGKIIKKPNLADLQQVIKKLVKNKIQSVAICFLHSYINPSNEETVYRELKNHGFSISVSNRILREYREFERASTTAVNAFVAPLMELYLENLEKNVGANRLHIMQSNGGSISAGSAKEKPVCTILSGPSGGVVGAKEIAFLAGFNSIISFDMGGTSTDVSLCDRSIMTTNESMISGLPLRLPIIDIHTVGSGGGSIAFIDEGGALRVGPQSAGADPGPVCYGKGNQITVTDANLVLGRIDPDSFLAGKMPIYPAITHERMKKIAASLKMNEYQLAEGIIRIADATMERAIRVISIERGYDPRDFSLLSFGGAGGLHACSLAKKLHIPTVIVPRFAGVLSALGMLLSDTIRDYSRSILKRGHETGLSELNSLFKPILKQAWQDLTHEGFNPDKIQLQQFLDLRYVGQSYELTVPYTPNYRKAFDKLHQQRYRYVDEKRPIEIVNLSVKAIGITDKPVIRKMALKGRNADQAMIARRKMMFVGKYMPANVYKRNLLEAGNIFPGPALIVDFESTAILPPDYSCRVDSYGNLIITEKGR